MKQLCPALLLCLALAGEPALAGESALSTYTEESSSISVKTSWPRLGLARPDRESDELVRNHVEMFRRTAGQEQEALRKLRKEEPDLPEHVFEMVLEGASHGNGRVAGILWKAYQYTGGAHGSLVVFSKNYAVRDGRAVELKDLFRNPKKALALMSGLSRKKLLERGLPGDMVEAGTAPEEDNFSTFLLEKDGLTLYFSPYQVGPWSEGVVTVQLPLKELAEAQPDMTWWK